MYTMIHKWCPYCQVGLFDHLFDWLQKFGEHLKTMIIVTFSFSYETFTKTMKLN